MIATLSGGAAVSIYSDNKYQSEDLDFVTAALISEIAETLEPLGFERTGRPRLSVFEHPKSQWYIEFPPAPLSFGGTYIDQSSRSTGDHSLPDSMVLSLDSPVLGVLTGGRIFVRKRMYRYGR